MRLMCRVVTVSSCALTSRPCASTALPYSSTGTLTMLATRPEGCSWAAAGMAAASAASSEKRLRMVVILIAERIYRN